MADPFLGEIQMFGGNFAPRGWALCNGDLLPIASYSALFSLLGTSYGGDGRSTFGLPDLRGRVPLHQGTGPSLTTRNLGSKGGEQNVTLTEPHLPAHTHLLPASDRRASTTHPHSVSPARRPTPAFAAATIPTAEMHELTIAPDGGAAAHYNIQPFLAVNFIIALQGVFPSRN